jgi:hypothetical protein
VAKSKKTARELSEMIAAELPVKGARFDVRKDAAGWHAVVYGSSPDDVARTQAEVDQIVQRLRLTYDLDG